jgi:hypothetical protein
MVGDGQLPPELNRVNWGAFWLTWLWAIFNGLWEWALIILVSVFALDQFASGVAYWIGGLNAVGWVIFVDRLFAGVFGAAVSVVFGVWGNRLVWWRERRRIAASGGNPKRPRMLDHYLGAQRGWTIAGFIVAGVFLLADVLIWRLQPETLGPTSLVRFGASVIGVAAVLMVDRLQTRRRREANNRIQQNAGS